MPKRTSESGQMRREEYEAMENQDSEEAGVWQKASSNVIRKRKILKVRRKGSSGPSVAASKPAASKGSIFGGLGGSFGGGGSTSNNSSGKSTTSGTGGSIFGGLSSFGTSSDTTTSSSGLNNNNNNGGSGMFNFGNNNKPSTSSKRSSSNNNSFITTTTTTTTTSNKNNSNSNSNYRSTTNGNGTDSDMKKLIGLNLAFADWVKKQHGKNPSISWAKGLQGYLKQSASFVDKKKSNTSKASSSNKSNSFFTAPTAQTSSATSKSSSSNFNFNTTNNSTSSTPLFNIPKKTAVKDEAPAKISTSSSNISSSGSSGDDDEDEVLKVRVKILRFRKDDKEQPWGDMGIHQVSIMTNPSTKKSRILARDETPLAKLQINTNLYKGMKVDRSGKRDVQIYLIVDDGKMTMYSIRCKSGDIADKLCQTIKNAAEGVVGGGGGGDSSSSSNNSNNTFKVPAPKIPTKSSSNTTSSSSSGSSDEDEVLKVRVKILRFRKDDKEQPWGDMGIHQVSIMTNPSTKKSRILARDETPLAKLQINTNLYKGMKVDRSGKRDVQIYLIVDDGKMTMYSIRCKSGDIADKLCQTIKNAAASC